MKYLIVKRLKSENHTTRGILMGTRQKQHRHFIYHKHTEQEKKKKKQLPPFSSLSKQMLFVDDLRFTERASSEKNFKEEVEFYFYMVLRFEEVSFFFFCKRCCVHKTNTHMHMRESVCVCV